MKFTRSQKICFGLLGAGLVALVADRSFGGSGGAAAAVVAAQTVNGPVDSGVAPVAASSAAGPSLAARLDALVPDEWVGTSVADAFNTTAAVSAPNAPATDATSHAFKKSHTLKAVLGSGRGGRVLVDDQFVAVGESFHGMELVDVRERQAVFAGPAGRVTIELPGASIGR